MAFTSRGKVPHFSMRPHPALVGGMIMLTVVGLLVALSFFSKEFGSGEFKRKGILVLMVTGLFDMFLLILATAKLWFPHLWKKNSTHNRHRHHSHHHPAMKDRQFREQRSQQKRR